jgi:signal peptidase II
MECCNQRSSKAWCSRALTLCLCVFLFLIDRGAKLFALHYFKEEYIVNPYLYFQLGFNRGISWGVLNVPDSFVFLGVTSLVVTVTCFFAWYAYKRFQDGFLIIGELLVLTGSLSNIIDRLWYKGVIDFIGIQLGTWSFPVFNGADALVVGGIGLLFIQQVLYGK